MHEPGRNGENTMMIAALRAVRWRQWWPLAIGPAGILFVYAAHAMGWKAVLAKANLEFLALWLTLGSAMALAIRWRLTREPVYLVLAALAVAFLCREFHWEWTSKAVYAAVAAIGIWGYVWRGRIVPYLSVHPSFLLWLMSTAFMYFFSQVIARRAFRHVLPDEQLLHVSLEEIAETLAHTMLLIGSFLPLYGGKDRRSRES